MGKSFMNSRFAFCFGIYPKKLLKFNDFTFLKIGVIKDSAIAEKIGYGTQIVFMNLYVAAWLFVTVKSPTPA